MQKETVIKSPLNYVGGKGKIVPSIKALIPENISTFFDIFGGGYNVGVNIPARRHVYNDINKKVVGIIEVLANNPVADILKRIDGYVEEYSLSKENAEGFNRIRSFYNSSEERDPLMLYTIIAHAFNYQIRFNGKDEYNMPFGKDRSCFSEALRNKLITFCEAIQEQDLSIYSQRFEDFNPNNFENDDLVYLDPPYFNSVAAYNEKDGWTESDEKNLWTWIEELNRNNVRFILSNNLKYNNEYLKDAIGKYHTVHIGSQYGNCNYHKKDKANNDDEVLVFNF